MKTFSVFLAFLLGLINSLLSQDFIRSPVRSEFSIIEKTGDFIKVEIKVSDEDLIDFNLEERLKAEFSENQTPYLYRGKFIAVEESYIPDIVVNSVDSTIIAINPEMWPYRPGHTDYSRAAIRDLPVTMCGQPGKLGHLTVVPIAVKQFELRDDHVICYHKIKIAIHASLSGNCNTLTHYGRVRFEREKIESSAFHTLYQSVILNYEPNRAKNGIGLPGKYLIITPDVLYTNDLLQLARWKELKGYSVSIKRLSEIGSSYSAIRNYIMQFYNANPTLEYVLLVGSASLLPSIPIPGTSSIGDHLYSCVAGNDIYPDLFVGRLPASNASELAVMVAKILGYEKSPWVQDTSWYRRALMVGTQYSSTAVVWTALATLRWTRNKFLQNNYLRVDTIFDPPYNSGVGIIDTIITRGVSFVNGRGWGNRFGWDRPAFHSDNISLCNNGWKLPVITSFYCATGNFAFDPCFGKVWLSSGTPTQPKGAVAFYGPTYGTTSTRYNNCHNYGVYWGIFDEGITHCGPAMFRGKLEMMANFPLSRDSVDLKIHTFTYNLFGDPSLQMWIGKVPDSLFCSYSQSIPVGTSQFSVLVNNRVGQPVANALVSLYKQNEVKVVARTNNQGVANFDILVQTPDTLFVTVTAQNYIPHQGMSYVVSSPVYVGYYSHSGNLIAGQNINLSVSLKNYGTSQSASNTVAILRTDDPHIQLLDSVKSYGNVLPGQIAVNSFQVAVAPNCTNGHQVRFQLFITTQSGAYQSGFSCQMRAGELSYLRHQVLDGNNQILEPGESANLLVKIYNRGLENVHNVSGILRFANPAAIRILDSLGYFGSVLSGDSAQNSTDYFTIQASSQIAVGHQFYMQLVLRADNNYQRIVNVPVVVGVVNVSAVLGPDAYGYYAYDNVDVGYNQAPVYQWYEIDPNYGGSGIRIPLRNDDIKTIHLPFNFKFYGRNYNRLSVCSNGYLAMDSTNIADPYNWRLPGPLGAPAMIAPFWDDFHPDTMNASGVYYYYDASSHRFCVQWSRVRHIHGFKTPEVGELQTFQVILFDPVYYPTQTGDGDILFQYHTVFNDDTTYDDNHNYATAGIENYEQTIATQLTFANQYPASVAPIVSGRAVKFTTNPPDTFTSIREEVATIC
ncbi:MAG: C25 family cysteine peptidase, partial [candidate division WOR-3 bacterium]|nr:C25 family cysteine peptidase [candidate division WOR-3 bacterium]